MAWATLGLAIATADSVGPHGICAGLFLVK